MKSKKNKKRTRLTVFIIITLIIDLGLAYAIAMMCQEDYFSDEEIMDSVQPALQEEVTTPAKEVPVITYHNIGPDSYVDELEDDKDNWISESTFEEHMKFFADNQYVTLTADEFYMWQQGEIDVPEKSVLITFDNCAYNVIKYGCPVLRELGLNATGFVRGKDTPDKTDKDSKDAPVGMDILSTIEEDWPELHMESQTYAVDSKSFAKMSGDEMGKDCEKQDEMFEEAGLYFVYVSNPYGELSKEMITALEDMGYLMAFTDGDDKKATRRNNVFKIPRITIAGDVYADDAFDGWPTE